MKILKIILILLIPAVGIVGCQKSDVKPSCGSNHEKTGAKASDSQSDIGSRTLNPSSENVNVDENKSTDIVGSGDDDRDGGDKKKKSLTK